jgi:hypothetical protein
MNLLSDRQMTLPGRLAGLSPQADQLCVDLVGGGDADAVRHRRIGCSCGFEHVRRLDLSELENDVKAFRRG